MKHAHPHQQMQWGIKSILQESYVVYVANWKFVFLYTGVVVVLAIPAVVLRMFVQDSDMSFLLASNAIGSVASLLTTYGYFKASIKMVRQQTPSLRDLIPESLNHFVIFVLGTIVLQIVVMLGTIALIIPGIYFALKYALVQYLIIDQNMSLKDAFGKSSRMTNGVKMKYVTTLIGIAAVTIMPLIATFVFAMLSLTTQSPYMRIVSVATGIFSLFYILIMSAITTFVQPIVYERLRVAAGLSPATLERMSEPVGGVVSTSS